MRGGVNVEAVGVLAGHSASNVTQRYVHAQAGDLFAAVARIGATSGQ